jgi:hypothetical protein
MKCPDFLLKAFANGVGVDCWCWNESKKDGIREDIIRFDVDAFPDSNNPEPFGASNNDWFLHAEPFIENYKTRHLLKPLDPVLVRNFDGSPWRIQLFDRVAYCGNDISYFTVGDMRYSQCILYETHKELKDTTNEPTDIK